MRTLCAATVSAVTVGGLFSAGHLWGGMAVRDMLPLSGYAFVALLLLGIWCWLAHILADGDAAKAETVRMARELANYRSLFDDAAAELRDSGRAPAARFAPLRGEEIVTCD